MKVKYSEIKPGEFFKWGEEGIFMRFQPKANERVTLLGNIVNCVWVTRALGDDQQTCNFCPDLDGDLMVERLVAKFAPEAEG